MQEHDSDEQTETTEDSGETVAAQDDSQVVDSVDQRAAELTGSGGAAAEAPQAGGDAISQAEQHLADVNMDDQRAQLEALQKGM